jgi:diacylglycerol kinase family enzyme
VPADVVVNCTARHLGDGSALREVVSAAASRCGARVHETRTLAELEVVAHDIASRGTDAVVLAGGDGSHMCGVSALARAFAAARAGDALPPVALAPGGTVCTVASNLGMRGGAQAWAERVMTEACSGAPRLREHATLRVRDDAGGERVGFIFGAGLVARFFDEYYGSGAQGVVPAAGIAARIFAGSLFGTSLAKRVLTPAACSVEVDGEPQAVRAWSLVLASVVRDVGLHVRATYRAGEEPGRFHVVASGLPPRGLAFEAPRVLLGRAMSRGPRVDALARSLRVSFDDESSYVLDGDVMRAREVRVEPGPSIRVVVATR